MKKQLMVTICGALLALGLFSGCLGTSIPVEPAVSAPAGTVTGPAPARSVTALPYTSEYQLFEEGGGNPENPRYGLLDRNGTEILPAKYKEISVADNGLLFVCLVEQDQEIYRILKQDGTQVGPDYSFIESATPNEEGENVYRQASFLEMAAGAPYAAWTGTDSARQYWLLDENGAPRDDGPYTDINLGGDGYFSYTKDGYRFDVAADGTLEKYGNEIVNTYFDGTYQVKQIFLSTHSTSYSLLDKDGNRVVPEDACKIQVPFEDRYILYKGHTMTVDGAQAFLYNGAGELLAENSNGYGYFTAPDGRYAGVSWVGNPFNRGEEGSPDGTTIYRADGTIEPRGYYFVDRDGNRISERYQCIDFFLNDTEVHKAPYYTTSGKSPYSEGTIQDTVVEQPGDAFFMVMDFDDQVTRVPFTDRLEQ